MAADPLSDCPVKQVAVRWVQEAAEHNGGVERALYTIEHVLVILSAFTKLPRPMLEDCKMRGIDKLRALHLKFRYIVWDRKCVPCPPFFPCF